MAGLTITKNQLIKMAEELENPDNVDLIAAEENDTLLEKTAISFSIVSNSLRKLAEQIEIIEDTSNDFTPEKLDQIAAVAESFADSDDELLQKQASVLDNLLITLAAPKNAWLLSTAEAEDDKTDQLKKKYKDIAEKLKEVNLIDVKAVEASPVYKEPEQRDHTLSTRMCPNHPGVSLHRVSDGVFRCPLDGKEICWEAGYEDIKGNKVPGGSISNQFIFDRPNSFTAFDSREDRLNEKSTNK